MTPLCQSLIEQFEKPIESLADPYQRILEALEASLEYISDNVDLGTSTTISKMSIDEIRSHLELKISHYKWYVKQPDTGKWRKVDELEEWIVNGQN